MTSPPSPGTGPDVSPVYGWRAPFLSAEAEALHAEGFGHPVGEHDWWARFTAHSLGWVCARDREGTLIGLVNVAWDGGEHAFLLDTVVARAARGRGVGRELVRRAAEGARAAGCGWLHVDHEPGLGAFYDASLGFRPTEAGLVRLDRTGPAPDARRPGP
ncbi:Acetyltransferase (GNAT) family protein [Streptomyces zhaozhouensis]|uniref:Acetyltransferase (GNAT) family protein n=1 Tax=Streptomyces zhaozhouensis TaxID=1300267 RepID=A0A286DXZ6_9ACTN|nr:GNAT family N-acetyltransferase [Streptomyces zhaozhouensis]SOD63500.1 Acetyltransferase (GNAT) family protein [Streptomyces zhaozhouensis]